MPEATAMPLSASLLVGRYRIIEHCGDTQLASIYAAVDERLQRRVLIHWLRQDLAGQAQPRARFLRRIGQMAQRSHPSLLEAYDTGESNGRPFAVTEYVTGRSLRDLGRLTVEQALLYVRQVTGAVALCQAHRGPDAPLGLYHPPISSANLILADEGRVVLVDNWHLPPEARVADLACYRAPELSEGRDATLATPVYALGLLLYELITGVRPIGGSDAQAIAPAHLHARLPPLHHTLPTLHLPTVERLLARATAPDPAQRFPDAETFGAALDALWRDLAAPTQPLRLPPQVRPPATSPYASAPSASPMPAPSHPTPSAPAASPPSRRPLRAAALRRRNVIRGLTGWLTLIGLVSLTVTASYLAVNSLRGMVEGISIPAWRPTLPAPPVGSGPLDWLKELLGVNEVYVVNIAEGLNLRREPDASDNTNIIAVIPNGTPVQKLEGPRVVGNIPWVRVRVMLDGRQLEGWMSLNYLRRQG